MRHKDDAEMSKGIPTSATRVLDWGFIALEEVAADELAVVNSARVSLGKRHDKLKEGDDKLIAYLLKNRHGTPFEQSMFRWHVRAPIFVFRQWHRHRIGWSYNEMSGRYTELLDKYYLPRPEHIRIRHGAPGHYCYEMASEDQARYFRECTSYSCETALTTYKIQLERGIAPELARLCLPVNIYSEMICTCNARSLMHFLSLRNDSHAQWEFRQYAIAMEEMFKRLMPNTWAAFNDNGRVAP